MSRLQQLRARYQVSEDPLKTLRRMELVAVTLGLLMVLQLAWGVLSVATTSAPDAIAPAADAVRIPEVSSPAVVAAAERNEINARPLFWPSRRPVDEVAALVEADDKPGELKDVKLVGVFGSGEQAGIIALVKGKKRRILLGETVEGWTLADIQPTTTEFANGGRRETKSLERVAVKVNSSAKSRTKTGGGAKVVSPQPAAPEAAVAGDKKKQAPKPEPAEPEAERTLGLGPRMPGI